MKTHRRKRGSLKKIRRFSVMLFAVFIWAGFLTGGCSAGVPAGGEEQPEQETDTAEAREEEQGQEEQGPFSEENGVPLILVNRVGYKTAQDKEVVFTKYTSGEDNPELEETFEVVDITTGEAVYRGDILWNPAKDGEDERNGYGNFIQFREPGTYYIRTESRGSSFPFAIDDSVYQEKADEALRLFYAKRCGVPVLKEYTGAYERPACHTDGAVFYETGEPAEVFGGWHDAGGNRYVVPGCQAAADLLLAYRFQPEKFGDDLGIPESGNGIPDLLDEVRFEMEWLLRMQDADGSVFHKAADGIVYPASTAATADTAAVLAMFAQAYGSYDPVFAGQCRNAAEKAYSYLVKHLENQRFQNPEGDNSLEYGDGDDTDERYFAVAELYRLTGKRIYRQAAESYISHEPVMGLGWKEMGTFGMLAYLTTENATDMELCSMLMSQLLNEGSVLEHETKESAYHVSGREYLTEESDHVYLNNSMILIYTNSISPGEQYAEAIASHAGYFCGVNPQARNYLDSAGGYGPDATGTAWNGAAVFLLSYLK